MVTVEQVTTKVLAIEAKQDKIISWLKKKQDGIESIQILIDMVNEKKINNEKIDWEAALAYAVNIHTKENIEA